MYYHYRWFHDWGVMDFDEMQIIFKAITGSSGYAFWWERTALHSMETLVWHLPDACLVALESISPGQRIYYGTLRCRTLPSKENFPKQRLPPWFFCNRFFSRLYSAALSFPPRGMTGTSGYCFEYNLHLTKILSHLNCESIYSWANYHACKTCTWNFIIFNIRRSTVEENHIKHHHSTVVGTGQVSITTV